MSYLDFRDKISNLLRKNLKNEATKNRENLSIVYSNLRIFKIAGHKSDVETNWKLRICEKWHNAVKVKVKKLLDFCKNLYILWGFPDYFTHCSLMTTIQKLI